MFFGNSFAAFILCNTFALALGVLTFYNLKCEPFDKSFAEFEYCYIKAINRSLKHISVKVLLHQLPVTNATMTFAVSKRANGWKPFLYNYTVDACVFMKNRNRYPIMKYIYKTFENFSNINHTCPYNHDLIITNITTTFVESVANFLPVQKGEYRLQQLWGAYGKLRAEVVAFIRIS